MMKRVKKLFMAMALCGVMVTALGACGGGSAQKGSAAKETTKASVTIRVGMPTAGKHFSNYTAEQYKNAIEKASDGKIAVQIYPSSQLGTATQMIQGVQDGSIESVIIPSSYFSSFAPASAVTDIPYFFKDADQIYKVLNNDNPLNSYMEKKGFTVGAWLKNTPRYILSQKKYTSVSDIRNQKIWCLPSTTLQDELKAYGASPQALDPADISVSLENGTVDGVETDVIFMNSMGLGESAKYLNEVPSTPMINVFCFSTTWLDSLTQDQKDLILKTAKQVTESKEVPYVEQAYNNSLNALKDAGVKESKPSAELTNELKRKADKVKEEFINTDSDCKSIYDALEKQILADK
ncbi:MAG: TRAP transporter substrate-binding protein [Lachnospiraceae bacterium]|jgi:C4-dicarboxylate-binding protein DctP|nr:TRAP transporter substrate-binding protein [Lachnospiraceae bacterium]MCI1656873.1 TRAP transporter substrate-binding protein [Lachnospiraceae bacterium]MCI2195121.1 TRAP transporter substrate-binding protein [Lachnospiraceae bacterium]